MQVWSLRFFMTILIFSHYKEPLSYAASPISLNRQMLDSQTYPLSRQTTMLQTDIRLTPLEDRLLCNRQTFRLTPLVDRLLCNRQMRVLVTRSNRPFSPSLHHSSNSEDTLFLSRSAESGMCRRSSEDKGQINLGQIKNI